jgi:hypothetical protein
MRWIIVFAVVGAGYWYLFGIDSQSGSPSYQQKLLSNKSAMSQCIKEAEYAASRMAKSADSAEQDCATKLKLYREDGGWHSYQDSRR